MTFHILIFHCRTPTYPTLGARDFSSAVSGFCQVFIVTRARASPLVASAFGQHRKFPPHARKTSGTQGKLIPNGGIEGIQLLAIVKKSEITKESARSHSF